MRFALAARTSSEANLSHALLEVVVGKQEYDQLVVTCAAHDSAAKKLQRAARHHLARRARRLGMRDALRRHIHAVRIAAIRSRAETMRAVDPNIDCSAPSIRGGRVGDSLDGTVRRIEKEPPSPFMFPTGSGSVDKLGEGLLIMPETPRLAAVQEETSSSLVLNNRYPNLSIESADFSGTPGSRASTCTLPTPARPAAAGGGTPTPPPRPSSRSTSTAASSRSSASSRVASLSMHDYERRCAARNAWISYVNEVKQAVKVMLPEIEAPQSATTVSARRPHTATWLGLTWLGLLHAPLPPAQAFFGEAAASLGLAVPPGTSFHVLVRMVDSNLFPEEFDARTSAMQTPALPSRACSLP